MPRTYTLGKSGITCNLCGFTSQHSQDVQQLYCGRCHLFHGDERLQWYVGLDDALHQQLLQALEALEMAAGVPAYRLIPVIILEAYYLRQAPGRHRPPRAPAKSTGSAGEGRQPLPEERG